MDLIQDIEIQLLKSKAKAKVRKRKEEEEAKRKEREALVQEIAETVLSRIERPKDGRDGRDGQDAPSLEQIMQEVRLALPEPKVVKETLQTTIREEVPEDKLVSLIQAQIPRAEPKVQVIKEEVDFQKEDYLTKEDFREELNRALRRVDQAIQSSSGGGSPREVPIKDFQFISSLSDFPRPRNKVIELPAEKVYFICGDIDLLGNRLVLGEDTCLLGGSSENASLTSTGLDPNLYMIETDWTFPCRHITFRNVSRAIGVNLNNTSTDTNLALDWTGVNFEGCDINLRCGDIGNFIFDKGAVLGSGSIQFFGVVGTIALNNSLFVGDGSASNLVQVESTASINRRFRSIYSAYVAFGSTVAIDFDVAASTPNESYILDTCSFTGGGTYLTGVQASDNKALFSTNTGIINSADISQYYMNGNATATIISSTGLPVKVAGATTSASITSKFTNTDNRATYIGALNRFFKVTATMSLSSGNGNQIGTYISKNGAILSESEIYVTTNASGRAENVTVQTLVQLQNDDYIEVFVENNTSINNITVSDLNVIVE